MFRLLAAALLLCACPSSQSTGGDAATTDGSNDPADASTGAWRHTITIDGVNDFAIAETFSTTTVGYAAYVTWDDSHLFVGYAGADIAVDAPDSETTWVLIYLDTDPDNGATAGERYNTQQPGFPADFRADHYYRWKSNDTFEGLRTFTGTDWTDGTIDTDATVTGEFMELALPLSTLGSPSAISIITLMLNEKALSEYSYAGLYAGSFTDGYFDADVAPIPITAALHADFATAAPPTDPSRGP